MGMSAAPLDKKQPPSTAAGVVLKYGGQKNGLNKLLRLPSTIAYPD